MFSTTTIKKITPIGVRTVADITVADNHSYVGNGIVSHNSETPNLQNITTHVKIKHPFVEEVTTSVKKCFLVPKGYTLINWDFSQAELRMIADLANEVNMIAAYKAGVDLHKLTASKLMKITLEEFLQLPKVEQDEWRQKAKAANFGLIYGQSAEGFKDYAKNTYGVKMNLKEAIEIHTAFFVAYPAILQYHEDYINKQKQHGCVRTVFGRRGRYPDVDSVDDFLRGNAERELVNFPVQGSNGENTVFALALLERRLPKSVQLVNTVHDSIMAYVPDRLVPYVVKVGIDTCVNTPMLRFFGKQMKHLSMAVDAQFSKTNWKALENWDEEKWRESIC